MIAAYATDTYDRFTVYGGIMARSPGNATSVPVPPPSTLFGVSMPASPYGTLAAVTRPDWAPSGVDIAKPSVARVYDYYRMTDGARETESLYNRSVASLTMRTYDEVVRLFAGETLIDPGVVQIPYWRPDQHDDLDADVARYPGYAGVARID